MIELNFELPAFLLSVFCLVYCLTAKRRQYTPPKTLKGVLKSQNFIFLIMIIANIFCAASSVVGDYLAGSGIEGIHFLQYLIYTVYFFFHSTLSILFALYIMNVTGTGVKWKRTSYFFFSIPYIVSEILVLINGFNDWTFTVDDNLFYHRGPLMYLLYGLGVFYVIIGVIFFIKNKKAISRADSIAVIVFMFFGALGIIIQAIFSSLQVELFFEALACLVIMIVLENKGERMDVITGLLNRLSFNDVNKRLLQAKSKYKIVLVRLKDSEKLIKILGEREVDIFLRHVSSFLLKTSDTKDVYRARRTTFAIIFRDEQYDIADDYPNIVLERFSNDWKIDNIVVAADVAVTLIRVPENISAFEELDNLISADYHKARPGSFFVPVEKIEEITRTGLYEKALKKAVQEGKLTLNYQPIWSIKEKKTVSVEALLRVECEELQGVSPEEYIPIAEKTGVIREIGLYVFEETCRFLSSPEIVNSPIRFVELNLSVYQLMYGDLIDRFEEIRKKYNVNSNMINLEITESAAALEDEIISEQLEKFYHLGYSLSLDDFGSGYSNLIRMMGSHYRNVKIDKSILWSISRDGRDLELLTNVISFVKQRGFDVIQEGVETKEELDLVIKFGCDYVQGFYFSRPITKDQLIVYLKEENK